MRCIIAGNSVKFFAKAIHCLAKIGEEIYLEPLNKGLSLRTVNSSRSAYACFLFLLNFFQSYDDGIHNISDKGHTPAEDVLKCKLSVKSCLSVFKSLSTIEKIVDRCSIKMDLEEATLTFLLYCHHGITKTYNLTYQDSESLQAVFTKDLCPNVIIAQPRIFSEVIINFQNSQEEITLTVCPQAVKVTNYVGDEPDPDKVIRTEMVLVPEEFDNYQIGVDTEVTFCLKELKAILTFAESSGQPMDIHFEIGGKPIVFSLTSDPTFEANFVLATLIDQPPSSQGSQQVNTKTETPRKTTEPKKTGRQCNSRSVEGGKLGDEFDLRDHDEEAWGESVIADVVNEPTTRKSAEIKNERVKDPGDWSNNGNVTGKSKDVVGEDFFGDSFQYQSLFPKKTRKHQAQSQTRPAKDNGEKRKEESFCGVNPVQTTTPNFVSCESSLKYPDMPFLGGSMSADSEKSPGIAVRSGKNKGGKILVQKAFEEEKLSEETVPGTPPRKKFKSMFFSAMSDGEDATNKIAVDQDDAVVLAADTDEESD